MRGGLVSKVVADRFVEAPVEIHAGDCDVGNVAAPRIQHASAFQASACQLVSTLRLRLRLSARRLASPDGFSALQHFSKLLESLAPSIEPERHRMWFLVRS
jgi:hypothetical protein